ncbi:Protein virilizer [Clonorchis sinensis]|uniref:Protein virilizer n=1 Tax=Clonorchis sinensis TaxID=79923 RepID=A0A8T1N0H3_CLOSI|nr:Protein virilizer [Clonorchis sinensis]
MVSSRTHQRLSKVYLESSVAAHIEKSPWVSVCREVISFTIAAPLNYLPGLKLLLELLPLPLPIYTIEPLDDAKQKKLRSARDQWSVYLIGLAPELTGLVELLGGTDPIQSNPLYTALQQLITRLADLGYPCATFLATSCLDSLFAVWDELTEEQRKLPSSTAVADGSNAEDSDKASEVQRIQLGVFCLKFLVRECGLSWTIGLSVTVVF